MKSEREHEAEFRLVTVFAAADAGQVVLAKSMLQAAGIEYVSRNEDVQDVFGWGRFPTGLNIAMGPVELQVREEGADYARELLSVSAEPVSGPEGS